MPQIILNAEQAKTVATALDPIKVRDEKGNYLGTLAPIWTREDVEQAKKDLADPKMEWYTLDEVMSQLRSLEQK